MASLLDDAFAVHQNDPPALLNVLNNDSFDAAYTGNKKITSVSYGSEGGFVSIAEDGRAVRYAPPADFAGTESIVYVVDGQFSASVHVSISSPLANDEFVIPPDGVERRLGVLDNDPFWASYSGLRQITSVSVASAGGAVTIADDHRSVYYTPPVEAFGTETFLYIVDGVFPARVTVSIPRALQSDRFEMVQNTEALLSVLSNDPFWPGYSGQRRITHVSETNLQGTLEISADGRSLAYAPPPNLSGWDSFSYVVDATYEEYVSVVIHRPVRDDAFQIDQNSSDQSFPVISNDVYKDLSGRTRDVVNRVTFVAPSDHGGTTVISSDGQTIIYTPPAGFSGTDTFNYVADDRHQALVTVTVSRPVRDDYFSQGIYQDTPNARLDVLANDFLGNGYAGPRNITDVGVTKNGGQVVLAPDGRSLLYSPASGFVGQDSFTYTIDGQLTAQVTLNVQALAQNDYFSFCADPTHVPFSLNVLANDFFRAGYPGPGVITAVSAVENGGHVTLAAGQPLLYTPSSSGWSSFRYTVDAQYEATASISLINQLSGDSFVVDQNTPRTLDVLANDFRWNSWATCNSANYSGPRRITAVGDSAFGGSVSVAPDRRMLNYEPPADFHGTDSFTYTVDGLMQATVQVQVIRRVRDDLFRVDAASAGESLPVLVNDLFGADYRGPRTITYVSESAAGGTVSVGGNGRSIHYTPAIGFVGEDTFTYTVDGALKAEVRVVVDANADARFPRFAGLEEFQQFLINDALVRYEHLFGQPAWLGCPMCDFLGPVTMGPESNRTHSETNVQVDGVDEGDIVEFDSDYVYVLNDTQLVIVDAWPAEQMSVASRVDIEGTPIAEYLKGDRLTVISEVGGGYPGGTQFPDGRFGPEIWPALPPVPPSTIVTVLDVTDRTAPTIVQTTSMEGRYVQSRGIGDFVYVLVGNDNAVAPPPLILSEEHGDPQQECPADDPTPLPFGPTGVYETREAYLERIVTNPGVLVDAALPNFSSFGPQGKLVRTGLLIEPEGIYRPLLPNVSNLVNVVSFHVAGNEPGLAATSGVYATGAGIVYASLENFYVFDSDYSPEDGSLTRIMKFDWDATTGGVDFTAASAVPGSMLNQFSADEHDGYLRVATTIGNQGAGNFTGRAENTLFVLQEDSGVFEFVGSLQNLALGEAIQSVRFMRDQALVTTFAVIDPLFGLNLSDPTNPHSVGHLTLPGFSTYMQMIDQTHLLTVGRNTPGGFSGPTQVSLFDVSDLSRPRQIDQYTFERFSTSEAELDHHAFGYFSEHGLLALPISRGYIQRVDRDGDGYSETSQWVQENRLAILAIDAALEDPSDEGVQWLAEIEHAAQVRRSGYIDDMLYSIAADSIKVVHVSDPSITIRHLELREKGIDPPSTGGVDGSSPPGENNGTEPRFPASQPEGALASALRRAQEHLAGQLGIDPGASLVVAAQTTALNRFEIVLRVADRQYRYRAWAETGIHLVDPDFEFPDATDPTDVWHDIRQDADYETTAPPRNVQKLGAGGQLQRGRF